MGTVLPFPMRRTQGETRGVRALTENAGEVVILPVVQCVRSGPNPPAPDEGAEQGPVHESR